MHEAVAETVRLDADADGRAADRDVLQLGRDEGHQPVAERAVHNRFVGGEPLNLERAGGTVDLEHVIEVAEVERIA